MNNLTNKVPGSGNTSPSNVPQQQLQQESGMGLPSERKRQAGDAGMDVGSQLQLQGGSMHGIERPNKRPFVGAPTMAATAEEKLSSPMHQGFPLRNGLMGASLLNQNQEAQRLADYQSSLLASSLANRHAELAQRQLLTRYFSPQLRLNSLTTSLASPPALGLGSLAGHQLPGTAGSAAGANTNATGAFGGFLSMNQQDPLQSMAARFQQQQQALPSTSLASADNFQTLPATGSAHRSERLQEVGAMGAGAGMANATGMPGVPRPPAGLLQNVPDMQQQPAQAAEGSASPIPLGIDEDPNWLSDFHVFVRKHLVELCWASSEDVALRNASNRVSSHQVGIRCRCCAHLNPSARAQRSSAFPSSIAQIYQSFTMMLRAHFSSCTEVPPALKEKFLALKSKTTQGATDSKQYWIYSARKLGMVDSDDGIVMTKATTSAARNLPPFGSNPATGRGGEESSPLPLVAPNDRQVASDFLYTLLLQARRVRLQANEQRGNKKSLQLGLPGFACRHCCQLGRMGQCRIFPARRRTLPTKVYDLYEHLMRCTACPQETKELLEVLHERENYQAKTPGHKEFLDMIWSRLVEQQQHS